jgi:hypothetical protein
MKLLITVIFFILSLITAQDVQARKNSQAPRFFTLVNPVRGRDRWYDKSLSPISEQYFLIKSHGLSATWLIQYDVMADRDLLDEIKRFNKNQEIGLLLEVSPSLANESRVIYPHGVAWFDPNAIFLSGYSQSERRKIVDKLFETFKAEFGYYPESVGAWWIDSYSLEYMEEKFGIEAALIVANQKTTDNYRVWGQWWGIPYFPSRANILVPATNERNKQDVVIIQWAQRDISRAYGEGPMFSNYSLQANDYSERGENIKYFEYLIDKYLNVDLPIRQVTVGLETGIESVKSFSEYEKQITLLSNLKDVESVTMSQFARIFRNEYKVNPFAVELKDDQSEWILTAKKRQNIQLGDEVYYDQDKSFSDYFVPDHSKFLNRDLSSLDLDPSTLYLFPFFPAAFVICLFYALKRKIGGIYLSLSAFLFSSYILVFRSFTMYGWSVYYGPVVSNIGISKTILAIFLATSTYIAIMKKDMLKKYENIFFLTPLTYGFDFLLFKARYTFLEGYHYLGFSLDALKFLGIKFSENGVSLINQNFSSVQASSLLKFNWMGIWNRNFLWIVVYPVLHIFLGIIFWLLIRKTPRRINYLIVSLAVIFYFSFLIFMFGLDPRAVRPI